MSGDDSNAAPPIPASNTSIQHANWSGSLPVLLSLAPSSLSSPTPPRPIHRMIPRATYLHLALHEEVMQLSGYAPVGVGLSKAMSGVSVEEPPDDDDDGPSAEGGEGERSGENNNDESLDTNAAAAAAEKEASTESDPQPHKSNNDKAPHPECWFEDEASGVPLRWHIFVGVLYDLMKGRTKMQHYSWASDEPTRQNFLPWRIRVHFTSYPTDKLLPLDDGLDHTINNDEEGNGRVTNLVKRLFRNSLKQALFMQYASSKVAMAITKSSHEKIWNAVLESNYESYHEVNVDLQSGLKTPSISTQSSTILTAVEDEQGKDVPQLIPIRIMLNGMPAIQKPIKHQKESEDVERKRPMELLEKLGTYEAPPYTTLGDVLAGSLPDYFTVDPSTCCAAVVSDLAVYYCVQGVCPSMKCAMVDLWRALSHPDHFLYIIVVTE